MSVDVIRAVNKGLEGIAVNSCKHAQTLREYMIRDGKMKFKGLSAQQIADVTAGALVNMRENNTSLKEAVSLATATYRSPAAEVSGGIAAKILGEASSAPKSVDRKVPLSQRIPEKVPTPPQAPKPKQKFLENLNSAQKASFGITAIFAAFSCIGALDALSKIKKKGENGQSEIQPTQIAILIINTLLTVGLGYSALQQARGR